MRFELHIVLDFDAWAYRLKKWWIRKVGTPERDANGEIWGYRYKGVIHITP
jgi:hypothetical protein